MHVALMAGSLTRGGTERVLVTLADYLISQGDTVTVVTQHQVENEYSLNPKATRVVWELTEGEITSNRVKNFIQRFKKLQNVWKENNPDVILSFIGKNNFMALLTAPKKRKVAVSVRALPDLEYPSLWMKCMANFLYRRAGALILQTRDQGIFFSEGARRNAVILKNPINTSFLQEPYEGEREKTIVSVGRIDENKNHRMIIDAFAPLAKDHPEWKLVIYGDGDLRSELLKTVDSMGLSDQIILPGNVPNVAEQIKKTSVFVLGSDTEGSPNSLIEAMCLGLAPISTDCACGGPRELIEDGVNGYLIPVRDTAKMQEALQKLINDLHKIVEISSEAIKTRDIYQPQNVLDEWRDVLKKLCK